MSELTEDTEKVEGAEPTPPAEPDKASVADAVRAMAEEFKKSLAEQRTAPPAAPVVMTPHPDDIRRQQAAEYEQVRARVNELAAEGKVAEGQELFVQWLAAQSARSQIAVTDTPMFKSQIELAQREVKRDNPQAFERWGGEVQAEIASYPPEQRVLPSTWERALQSVKARHLDEIIADEVKARTEKVPPSAAGSRGNEGTQRGGTTNLNDAEMGVVRSFGLDPAAYRKERDSMAPYSQPDGSIMGVPILTDKVTPGRF